MSRFAAKQPHLQKKAGMWYDNATYNWKYRRSLDVGAGGKFDLAGSTVLMGATEPDKVV